MTGKTKIEWTEKTWNPIVGCSVVSPGCTNCYAMRTANQRLDGNPKAPHYEGATQRVNGNPVWTGKVSLAAERTLMAPLRWKKPAMIFVNSMGDLFHESVPDEWIDRVFAVMSMCPQHTFQVLTKRAYRMRNYVNCMVNSDDPGIAYAVDDLGGDYSNSDAVLPNVWLGVSAEDQARADERIPLLLDTPAAIRFVSCEPLLGDVDLTAIPAPRYVPEDHELDWKFNSLVTGDDYRLLDDSGKWFHGEGDYRDCNIDWVIAGGESGPGARPMHPDWARSLRDQCAAASVPFFFKQWGEWVLGALEGVDMGAAFMACEDTYGTFTAWTGSPCREFRQCGAEFMARIGKKAAGRLLDGREWNDMPLTAAQEAV